MRTEQKRNFICGWIVQKQLYKNECNKKIINRPDIIKIFLSRRSHTFSNLAHILSN